MSAFTPQRISLKGALLDFALIEWQERPHDDLVLAVAVAAWQAERLGPGSVCGVGSAPVQDRPRWMNRR